MFHRQDICSRIPVPKKGESVGCTLEYEPICGSDGNTYSNKCHFCVAQRKSKGTLTIRYIGECKEKEICRKYPPQEKSEPIFCTLEYEPICGSDGITYGNKCLFCAARRKSGNTLTIRYKGECIEEVLCNKYPVPEKGLPFVCTDEYDPICGSDGVTHGNKCYFCAAWRANIGSINAEKEALILNIRQAFL
ncbi:ovomucoid-like [Eublepharis macularius]|uniref:Ovomucoid-like n=1 Tax=Eublepharis macularius TaxID=481883 RepID=A0AA97J636_EUBMA|nr:ovomucoid-like [Eublepharis macularius]